MIEILLKTLEGNGRKFAMLIRNWDNKKDDEWIGETITNSSERRELIYQLLEIDDKIAEQITHEIPIYLGGESVIIADKKEDWYKDRDDSRNFYWSAYSKYLSDVKHWTDTSIYGLDNSTNEIVAHISNPLSEEAYSTKGLVVGYVQSGKTANFTGVIAKASDAGYRLVIVLAGTINILRAQTQRRIDKELIGKELLDYDDIYMENLPEDWDDFISHGDYPSKLESFDWDRLTDTRFDFKDLGTKASVLDFHKTEPNEPFNSPRNLYQSPAKLIVIKKLPSIIKKLIKNLETLRTELDEIPVLIIDDESDQAGINTKKPDANPSSEDNENRTATNQQIVRLIDLFKRCQYIGYTATPYANVLTNINDPKDLFPKDFIISLTKPEGYMGISDFVDPDLDTTDIDDNDFTYKEKAFIRGVDSEEYDDLATAVHSYILSGAIKIYRETTNPDKYKFTHHTMLVHTGMRQADHEADRSDVEKILKYINSPETLRKIQDLWDEDFLPVRDSQEPDAPMPPNFEELKSCISECLNRLEGGQRTMVLNTNNPETPDFDEKGIWCVFIGGNKLSRGYTVEGLTVSYFTRPSNQGDTLMQMGRWFGFRKGYRDLVRVFLGTSEGRGNVNLIEAFKEICSMEENLRDDLKRYSNDPEVTPFVVPPLIEIIGTILPTSPNKMWNVRVKSSNPGASTKTSTLVPKNSEDIAINNEGAVKLWQSLSDVRYDQELGGGDILFTAHHGIASIDSIRDFLKRFKWAGETPKSMKYLPDYFKNAKDDKGYNLDKVLIIAPQIKEDSRGSIWNKRFKVVFRSRKVKNPEEFKVFTTSVHKKVSKYLAGHGATQNDHNKVIEHPNQLTKSLKSSRQATMLFYPVREKNKSEDPISIGFEFAFPRNSKPSLVYTTRKDDGSVVVQES
jgi:hypothetical protein